MFRRLAAASGAALLSLLAFPVQSAVINVPGDHATLTAAIAAAATSDTILVTSNDTFAESINIDKPLAIRAAFGTSPRIAGSGTDPFVVKFSPGAQGSTFGSYDGGIIRINGDSFPGTNTLMNVVHFVHTAGLVTVERVKVEGHFNYTSANTAPPAGWKTRDSNEVFRIGTATAGAWGDVTLRYTEVEGGSHGIRIYTANNTNTLNVENCIFRVAQFGIRFAGSTNVNVDDSIFITENRATWPPLYYEGYFNRTVMINNSWFHTNGATNAIGAAARRGTATYSTNSVFSHNDTIATNSYLINMGSNSYSMSYHFDHCDLVSNSAQHMVVVAGTGANVGLRNLTFTNSNLINKGVGALVYLGAATHPGANGALIMQNNNQYNPNTTATQSIWPNPSPNGFTTYTVQTPVATLLPDYADPLAGNYTYTTPALLTAGSGGTPMGASLDYSSMSAGTVPVELSTFSLN